MKNVVVVAVHPDDETLACGGTLLRHKNEGDKVHWIIVTNISEDQGFSKEKVKSRQEEINRVAREFNFDSVVKFDFPTTQLEEFSKGKLIASLSKAFQDIKPNVVYLPFPGDAHSEHKFTFECAFACTKTFRYPFVEEVYAMETISETEFGPSFQNQVFNPNYFVDVTEYLQRKVEIFSIFESEIGEHPFPRSKRNLKAQATFRGAQSGFEYAESFMLLKQRR